MDSKLHRQVKKEEREKINTDDKSSKLLISNSILLGRILGVAENISRIEICATWNVCGLVEGWRDWLVLKIKEATNTNWSRRICWT